MNARLGDTIGCRPLFLTLLPVVLAAACSHPDSPSSGGGPQAEVNPDSGVDAPTQSIDEPTMTFPAGPGTPPPVKPVACTAEFCFVSPLPTGGSLLSIWGSAASDIYAVGRDGAALHFDGKVWSAIDLDVHGALFASVFGTRPDDVWMVGQNGLIVRWNGSTMWQPPSAVTSRLLNGVWGSSPNDVWFVGDGGTILHWNGTAFANVASPVSTDLQAIWGRAANDVWAVGGGGAVARSTIAHFDGTSWTQIDSPVKAGIAGAFSSVWGASKNDVYVTGVPGTYHWNGSAWEGLRSVRADVAVWGTGHDDVFAMSEDYGPQHFDGKTWQAASGPWGVLAAYGSRGDSWGVGTGGLLTHWNGTEWTQPPSRVDVMSFAPFSENDIWIIDAHDTLQHFDGKSLTQSQSGVSKLSATSTNDVWAIGKAGVFHWDGATWKQLDVVGIPDPEPALKDAGRFGVSATAPNDVWFANAHTVAHWNGTTTTTTDVGLLEYVSSIWAAGPNDAWLLVDTNAGSELRHSDGTNWTKVDLGTNATLHSVQGIGSEVWVLGDKDLILHRVGGAWQKVTSPVGIGVLHPTGPDEAWAPSAHEGSVMHWKSGAWSEVRTGATMWLQSFAGTGSDVWLGGDSGTILRHR